MKFGKLFELRIREHLLFVANLAVFITNSEHVPLQFYKFLMHVFSKS